MPSVTGIEVAADSCALVRVRTGRGTVTLSAAHVADSAQWPVDDTSRSELLRRVRRAHRFPRRARVVGWGLQSAALADPATEALLRPIREAGFRVDAVFTPPQALARLAAQVGPDRALAQPETATAWLALNRRGAAIAVVRGVDLLYSRTFDWTYHSPSRPQEELLQRYSLVAHLAPEVRHGMQMVRSGHGARVSQAITCGDLPDLRSLTMPLIEELDLEVETLDSMEGIALAGAARTAGVVEQAPALRIACAAAAAPVPRGYSRTASLARTAAGVAGAGVLGWWTYTLYTPRPRPDRTVQRSASPAPRAVARPPVRPPHEANQSAAVRENQGPPMAATPAAPAARPEPSPTSASRRVSPTAPAAAPPRNLEPPPAAAESPRPAGSSGDLAEAVIPPQPEVDELRRVPRLPELPPVRSRWASRPEAGDVRPARAAAPLKDPLPVISSILIASERRLALIDGKIVGEGDPVGPRVLLRIEPSAVVLREPSGHVVRVPIRGRGDAGSASDGP